jgi:transcriptional regulator with PAS, ATPase and Fis domain
MLVMSLANWWLISYPWAGNVRQLKHAIGAATAYADRVVLPEHLPSNVLQRVLVSSEEDGMVRFDLNISCNFTNHIDLKELGKKIF